MTHDTVTYFLIATALVWSVVYIWRRRVQLPGPILVALDKVLPFVILATSVWSIIYFGPTEPAPDYEDIALNLLAGIGLWHILQRLARPPFMKVYCRSCWWRLSTGRCGNTDVFRDNPARGTLIDEFHVNKCLKCGGYRSRLADLRAFGVKSS